MSTFVGFKKQITTRNSYEPDQGCRCGSCDIFTTTQLPCNKTGDIEDETSAWEDCCGGFCPQRRVCVPPDITQCNVGKNDQGDEPLKGIRWDTKAPNIACTYEASKMNSINVIDNYKNLFGKTENWKLMMEGLCSSQSTTCTIDPLTGKPFESCSNMNSVTTTGDECRTFYFSESDGVKDSIAQNYCIKHPKSADCKCLERSQDPNYNAVKPHVPFNDACWYPPCASASFNTTKELRNATCPSNVCQIVFENLKNNNVNIQDNQNAINCKFELPPTPPTPGPGPNPNPGPRPVPNPNPSGSVNVTAIVIISVAVLVVVVALIAAAASQRK